MNKAHILITVLITALSVLLGASATLNWAFYTGKICVDPLFSNTQVLPEPPHKGSAK